MGVFSRFKLAVPQIFRKRWLGRLCLALSVLTVVLVIFVTYIQVSIALTAKGKMYDQPQAIDGRYIGLVFGCDSRFGDRDNLYFTYRMDAVSQLWKEDKLRGVIVSGDNRSADYNEPKMMRKALVQRGVPDDKIIADYAGLRTLDSVVRSKKVFGAEKVLMISQRFQNERALSIAAAHQIEAIAFNAQDVSGRGGVKTKIREWGARVKMWLDIAVLDTQPKYLGKQEKLPF